MSGELRKVHQTEKLGWVFYQDPESIGGLDPARCGKWMVFFNPENLEFIEGITRAAVESGAVSEAKHTSPFALEIKRKGVCCFYLNGDDLEAHRKAIEFLLDNNLIRRTKTGRLYNASFKYDEQTRNREYGADFSAEIKLSDFVDLSTGEFVR